MRARFQDRAIDEAPPCYREIVRPAAGRRQRLWQQQSSGQHGEIEPITKNRQLEADHK